MKNDFNAINKEYTPEYCTMLEFVYGNGMMSEGGSEAIDAMLTGHEIKGKMILDVGSGLGGVALQRFGEKAWKDSIEGYKLIAKAQADEELIVMTFTDVKESL